MSKSVIFHILHSKIYILGIRKSYKNHNKYFTIEKSLYIKNRMSQYRQFLCLVFSVIF